MATESRRPEDAGGGALDTGPGRHERVEHDPAERVPRPPAPGDRELIEESPAVGERNREQEPVAVGGRQRLERPAGPRGWLERLPLIGRFFR